MRKRKTSLRALGCGMLTRQCERMKNRPRNVLYNNSRLSISVTKRLADAGRYALFIIKNINNAPCETARLVAPKATTVWHVTAYSDRRSAARPCTTLHTLEQRVEKTQPATIAPAGPGGAPCSGNSAPRPPVARATPPSDRPRGVVRSPPIRAAPRARRRAARVRPRPRLARRAIKRRVHTCHISRAAVARGENSSRRTAARGGFEASEQAYPWHAPRECCAARFARPVQRGASGCAAGSALGGNCVEERASRGDGAGPRGSCCG